MVKSNSRDHAGAPDEAVGKTGKQKAMAEILDWIKLLAIALTFSLLVRFFVFIPVLVDGSSMVPTLLDHEVMFVTRFVRYLEPIERGDIVILIPPVYMEESGKYYVKRVIGLPGDRLRIEDGIVYINENPLNEPYIISRWAGDYAEVTVPEGRYFVMGDNRGGSHDSRAAEIGTIARESIEGKSVFVIWPFSSWRTLPDPTYRLP